MDCKVTFNNVRYDTIEEARKANTAESKQMESFQRLQERVKDPEFNNAISYLYSKNPELSRIGDESQYKDYIARVELGIVINPNTETFNSKENIDFNPNSVGAINGFRNFLNVIEDPESSKNNFKEYANEAKEKYDVPSDFDLSDDIMESIALDNASREERVNVKVINQLYQKVSRLREFSKSSSVNKFEVENRINKYKDTIKALESQKSSKEEKEKFLLDLADAELNKVDETLKTGKVDDTILFDMLMSVSMWKDMKNLFPHMDNDNVVGKATLLETAIVRRSIDYIRNNSGDYNISEDDVEFLINDTGITSTLLDIKESRNAIVRMIGSSLQVAQLNRERSIKKRIEDLNKIAKKVPKDKRNKIFKTINGKKSINQLVYAIDQSYYDKVEELTKKRLNTKNNQELLENLIEDYKSGSSKANSNADRLTILNEFDKDVIDLIKSNYSDSDILKKAIKKQLGNIKKWYKDNVVLCDPRAFDKSVPTAVRDKLIQEFKSKVGNEFHANNLIEKGERAMDRYYSELSQQKEFLKNTTPDWKTELLKWRCHNDPFLNHTFRLDPSSLPTKLREAMFENISGFPEALISAPVGGKDHYSKEFEEVIKDPALKEYYMFMFDLATEANKILPYEVINGTGSGFINRVMLDTVNTFGSFGAMKGFAKLGKNMTGWFADYYDGEYIDTTDELGRKVGKIVTTKFQDIDKRIEDIENKLRLPGTTKDENTLLKKELEGLKTSYSSDPLESAEALLKTIEHYRHMKEIEDFMLLNKALVNRAKEKTSAGFKEGGENTKAFLNYSIDSVLFNMYKKVEGQSGKGQKYEDNVFEWYDVLPFKRSAKKKEANKLSKELNLREEKYQELKSKSKRGELLKPDELDLIREYEKLARSYSMLGGRRRTASKAVDTLINLNQYRVMALSPISAINNSMMGKVANLIEATGGELFGFKELRQAQGILLGSAKRFLSFKTIKSNEGEKLKNFIDEQGIMMEILEGQYGKTKISSDVLFTWMRSTDFHIKGETIAALMLRKTIETKNGPKVIWSLIQPNGELDRSQFTDEQWDNWINKERVRTSQFIMAAIKRLHGNMDPTNPMLLKATALGRAVAQFRASWLSQGMHNRFGKRRGNEILGINTEGRYITILDYFKNASKSEASGILNKFRDANSKLDSVGIANMRKNAMELSLLITVYITGMLLRGLLPDKDDWKKKSMLLSANLLYRTQQDLNTYWWSGSIGGFFRDVIPIFSIISDGNKGISSIVDYLIDDSENELDRQAKLLKGLGKNFPVTRAYFTTKTYLTKDVSKFNF